jgi:hypothetical protein
MILGSYLVPIPLFEDKVLCNQPDHTWEAQNQQTAQLRGEQGDGLNATGKAFSYSQQRDDETKPPVRVGSLAHQLLHGGGEGHRRAVQDDIGQYRVTTARE